MKRNRQGVTLVELLVAMSITGVVVAALLSFTSGTLQFSGRIVSEAERLGELRDVTGYVADNVRRARDIYPSPQISGANCTGVGQLPCIGLLVPEAGNPNSPAITRYIFLGYRFERRSDLPSAYKAPNAWADANTLVLKEYRRVICDDATATPCNGLVPTVSFPLADTEWYLVADNLTLRTDGGTTFQPFVYDAATNQMLLRFRVAMNNRGSVQYTPHSGAYELRINARNVVP